MRHAYPGGTFSFVDIPRDVLDLVCATWHPEEVWLYGSRARGTHGPDSDWDLLVVVPDHTPERLLDLSEAWAVTGDLRPCVEVYPVIRSDFDEGRQLVGSIARVATLEGRRVYAA